MQLNRNRIPAALLAAMMLLSVLLSAAFIAAEARHDCSGEDCATCRLIAEADNALSADRLGPAAAAAAAAVLFAVCAAAVSLTREAKCTVTPVDFRVRLDC